MATTDHTRWKAIGCLFCTHTTTGHRAATLQRRLHAHLSAFSVPAVPFSHDTGSFWERNRHQPDFRPVGHAQPQPASGGGGGGGRRPVVNRVCVDEFHHVGIITALYSSAKGGRAAVLGTVSEIRAYPWPAGLMEPVWSHEEIKAFVVRQFAKVAAMELLEELHILKHLGKTPIPSEWWEEKVMQAVALVTTSVKSPSRGVEVICINDFINDTLYQAHKLWYNHPRYSQFKGMGCFDSSKFEAFPGTLRGTVVDTTKYPYVYGYKPQPAPAPSKQTTAFVKAPETTTTSDNIRRPLPHKTRPEKCMLPEAKYGLDRYEDDEEPKYTPPGPPAAAPKPRQMMMLRYVPRPIQAPVVSRKAPEMPTVFIIKKKRKVPPTARTEPGIKAEQGGGSRALVQPVIKKERITCEGRIKKENSGVGGRPVQPAVNFVLPPVVRGVGLVGARDDGNSGRPKSGAVFTGRSICPRSGGVSNGGGLFRPRSGEGAFGGQSFLKPAPRSGEKRGVGGLGIKEQSKGGNRTFTSAVFVDITSD